MIAERLDQASRALWENYYPGTKPQTLKHLQEFINRIAQALESATKSTHKASESPVQKGNSQKKSPNIQNYKASVENESQWSKKNLVWTLKSGHITKECKSKHTCETWHYKHNTLLHLPDASKGFVSDSLTTNQATAGITTGIVPTAMVPVEDDSSKILHVPSHDRHRITDQFDLRVRSAADEFETSKTDNWINGIGNVSKTYRSGSVSLRLKTTSGHSVITVNAYVLPSLTQVLPEREFSIAKCFHQRSVDLADTEFNKPKKWKWFWTLMLQSNFPWWKISRRQWSSF